MNVRYEMTILRLLLVFCILFYALSGSADAKNESKDSVDSTQSIVQSIETVPENCVQNGCPEDMCFIPAGTFTMGCRVNDKRCRDNKPPTEITLTNGFCMDKFEVRTNNYEEYELEEITEEYKDDNYPAVWVDWVDAKAYCESLNKRLPTETEWEYAARAGTDTSFYWGNEFDERYAVLWENARKEYDGEGMVGQPEPVGTKLPNAFGLYDMVGNAEEWVYDCYEEDWYSKMPKENPVNDKADCDTRVVRGGNAHVPSANASISQRGWIKGKSIWIKSLGFRCAKDLNG